MRLEPIPVTASTLALRPVARDLDWIGDFFDYESGFVHTCLYGG